MSRFNPLSGAIRLALFTSAASLFATSAFAQGQDSEAADADDQVMEELVITGTRIKSQSITSSSPVTEIQREEFQFTGATRVDDLLNQYPQLSPYFDSFANNGAQGYATVDLRGLGADRTLTLVNGHRLAPGAGEVRDISIIPAALVSQVDILTGGASAVYGSDAIAGVVNFVLDREFEGVSVSAGYSAYQHDNDNEYIQGRLAARNFPFEEGGSGFDGISKNIDIAVGSSFADGAGHAMAWVTWRENQALFQGQRDYATCALNAAGTACGGSATNATGNFYFYQDGNGVSASLNSNGSWRNSYGAPYNYAPINYYQRPDERYTFGTSIKYEVNEHFRPYVDAMFVNRTSSIQVAESGAFFTPLRGLNCAAGFLGTACADLGLDPTQPLDVYVAKRNVEGGPRRSDFEDSSYRFVVGSEGSINENWSYNASFLYGHTSNDEQGINDFLTSRIQSALLGCPAGSFAGCLPYNVWQPNSVSVASANALAGVKLFKTSTALTVLNAYATGDLGFGFASADGQNVSLVVGAETRREEFSTIADSNSAAGNFAGAGAASPPVDGQTKVKELFLESAIPVYVGDGLLRSFALDAGYRLSDYDRSGNANTYKLGFTAEMGDYRVRGGYNHAIRAPGINDLFSQQRVVLFTTADICAGATPAFTAAQCANTGVSAAQYGNVPANPAGQNNQFIGGNLNLSPEEADTWTLGFVATPMENLQLTVDYYDIQLEDTIATIGAATILEFCARTGDPFLCDKIRRNPGSGDIWRSEAQFVENLTDNFGERSLRGIDFGANYSFEVLGGNVATSFNGSYLLEDESSPLPGVNEDATYDCAGVINVLCQSPEWRHIANVRYSRDVFSGNVRWRHYGKMDYVSNQGVPLTVDTLIRDRGGIGGYNYIDLSGSAAIGQFVELTVGVNNVFDKEPPLVGTDLAFNGNAPGGYDQVGRYFFSSISMKF